MIAPPRRQSHDELEALIKEARARQLRRRLLGATGVAIAAALGLSMYAVMTGGSVNGVTQANAGRASAPFCRSAQLSGSAGQDWFFANLMGAGVLDKITDLGKDEIATDI